MRKIYGFMMVALITFSAIAQEQERPESNTDLRGGKAMFTIEQTDDEEKVELSRTSAGDYFLIFTEDDEVHKNKLGREKAEKLNEQFSGLFLKLQYEMPADPKGCDAEWRLVLLGEEQKVCPKNEQKHQEILPVFKAMKQGARQ